VAARPPARPLYAEFLARVINIEAVQCYREAVTDDHTAHFFAEGRRPGVFGDFEWFLEGPEAFPWGPVAPAASDKLAPISLPMQHAWDAAVAAFEDFIAALIDGELVARGVYPATGIRSEVDPAEWRRTGLILDVRNGDLIEVRDGKRTMRWSAIVVLAAIQKQKLGRIDWDDWWKHEADRRQRGLLPDEKAYLGEAEALIKELYGVTTTPATELRRIKAALYRGDSERPKRQRKQPRLKS
jgi:hypothetical protein